MAGKTGRKKAAKPHKKTSTKPKARRGRKGLGFGFLVFVIFFLAGTGVFMLVQHQYAVRCDLKANKLSQEVSNEKSRQERLRLSLARLKSPGRVARIAYDELGLSEPGGVIYLKYERDAKGNIVCESTYEERAEAPPAPTSPETGEQEGADAGTVVEGPSGELTRAQ